MALRPSHGSHCRYPSRAYATLQGCRRKEVYVCKGLENLRLRVPAASPGIGFLKAASRQAFQAWKAAINWSKITSRPDAASSTAGITGVVAQAAGDGRTWPRLHETQPRPGTGSGTECSGFGQPAKTVRSQPPPPSLAPCLSAKNSGPSAGSISDAQPFRIGECLC